MSTAKQRGPRYPDSTTNPRRQSHNSDLSDLSKFLVQMNSRRRDKQRRPKWFQTSTADGEALPPDWEMEISTSRRRVYFLDHQTRITTWRDPRDPGFPTDPVSQVHRKACYLRAQLESAMLPGSIDIEIRRSHIVEDSFELFKGLSGEALRRTPHVKFQGEVANKERDMTSEYIHLLVERLLRVDTGFFEPCRNGDDRNNDSVKIAESCILVADYLEYFEFVGKVYGLAIFCGVLVDPRIVNVIYPALVLNKDGFSTHELIKKYLEEFPELLQMTYTEGRRFLESSILTDYRTKAPLKLELNPWDLSYQLFDPDDHEELLGTVTAFQCCPSPELTQPLRALMAGFHAVLDRSCFMAYTKREAEKFIGGVSEIQADFHSKHFPTLAVEPGSDEQVEWFWDCIRAWAPGDHKALLRFMTGATLVPITDLFKVEIRPSGQIRSLTIQVLEEDIELPTHVLFLPVFENHQSMEQTLLNIIYPKQSPVGNPWSRALRGMKRAIFRQKPVGREEPSVEQV